MLRKLRNIFFSLLALLVILLATLSALVETETGSRWVVERIASFAGIKLGSVSGNLRTGLDLEFIEYNLVEEQVAAEVKSVETHIRAEQVSFRWRPVHLLYSALAIQSLSANKITIRLPETVEDNKSAEPFNKWPHLRLPVRIFLDQIFLNDIEYQQGATNLRWNKLSGSLSWGTFNLRYLNLALDADEYALNLTGVTGLAFPYASNAKLEWQWRAAVTEENPEPLQYVGQTKLTGDLHSLKLDNQISAPLVLAAQVEAALVDAQQYLQTGPAMSLQLEWQPQTLPAQWWVPEQQMPVTSGKLTAQGNWENYQVQLNGDIHLPHTPVLAIQATAGGDLQKIAIEQLHIFELDEAAANGAATPTTTNDARGLTLAGQVRWSPQLEWNLDANAKRLNAGSLLENWTSSINASFKTRGGFDSIKQQWSAALQNLQLSGELRGVNLHGSGDIQFDGAVFHSPGLNLALGANQLQVKGDVGESLALEWDLRAPLLQQLDESLRGSVNSNGFVRGNLKKPQVKANAIAENFQWQDYSVDKLELSLTPGADALMAAGENQPASENENISGKIAQELLTENYQLSFAATQLRIGGNRFSNIQLNGDGSFSRHNLQAVVKSVNYGRADIKLAGNFNGDEWSGTLQQLAVKLKKVPRWWLTSSKPIRVNKEGFILGSQCLTTRTNLTGIMDRVSEVEQEQTINEWIPNQSPVKNPYGWLVTQQPLPMNSVERYSLPQLCVRGGWATATGTKFIAQLDSVPLRQFLYLFKTEVYFAGVMDGSLQLDAKTFALADIKADANITTRNAELRYQYAGGGTEVYPWRDFKVSASLEKSQLGANAFMEWVGYGQINASTQLDLAQQKINQGEVHAAFSSLAPLETLLSFANDVKGDLRADLTLGGTFAKPYVLGDISLRNGSANVPRLGVDLTNIELSINSNQAGNISWTSQVQSDKGRLSIVGDLNQFGMENWNLEAYVKGADFQVANLQELKATLSPDIKITATQQEMHITGDAVIPWARANIKTLPATAVQVSSDAVIIDDGSAQDIPGPAIDIHTNLNLSLGNDVSFRGFGLISKLTGKINLLKEANRQYFTSGYVSVSEGTYKAYGQTLTIDRGRLLFQGPYENPGIEIKASRVIRAEEEITVGLDITGTLQRPKATVFSSGSGVSDSDAMRMLLTGKPAGEFGKGDASILLSAMGGLGSDSGEGLTAGINKFFHVDELTVKSDQGFDQSELWVGKYITPKLLVRYVVGIFNKAFGLGMEYQLSDHLRLEALSGEAQSVDMVYKIER
jgi:translocation and assembly module TamB